MNRSRRLLILRFLLGGDGTEIAYLVRVLLTPFDVLQAGNYQPEPTHVCVTVTSHVQ